MFKLALNAGHYKYTAGKRCHKDIDPNETREWVLNDRICDKIEKMLSEYDGIEVLRIDDTTGEKETSLSERTTKANEWGADFYLAIHHNAAGKKFSGGGIVAYVYTSPSSESVAWQKALYDASIKATGLKGNRSTPLSKSNLHEVRETKMPAVLMECGFMDSTTDCPIILTEDFADKIAKAFVEVIVAKSGATKKVVNTKSVIYRVQVGAYSNKANADKMLLKLKKDGYDAIIVRVEK
jgi:N-acetylmuramoyl-L-alanine amidase